MGDVKKCMRCGCLFTSKGDVCSNCTMKDNMDIFKLKNFLEGDFNSSTTKQQCINTTGISNKNLTRFLSYDDFSNIKFFGETDAAVNYLGDRTDGIVQDQYDEETDKAKEGLQSKKDSTPTEQT